jgi:hypothetical protein
MTGRNADPVLIASDVRFVTAVSKKEEGIVWERDPPPICAMAQPKENIIQLIGMRNIHPPRYYQNMKDYFLSVGFPPMFRKKALENPFWRN